MIDDQKTTKNSITKSSASDTYLERFSLEKFGTKEDRDAAINAEIDRLAKKRDYAADVENKVVVAMSYQWDIDKLVELVECTG